MERDSKVSSEKERERMGEVGGKKISREMFFKLNEIQ